MGRKGGGGGVVYSTQHGEMCPGCGRPVADCACREEDPGAAGGGPVRVRKEVQGRKGKVVTVVTGVPLGREELARLGKELKRKCGSGGTVKDGAIEIQGDHRDRLVPELEKRGWRVVRAGG